MATADPVEEMARLRIQAAKHMETADKQCVGMKGNLRTSTGWLEYGRSQGLTVALDALEAERAALIDEVRKALEPFARAADETMRLSGRVRDDIWWVSVGNVRLTFGDLRRARDTLARLGSGEAAVGEERGRTVAMLAEALEDVLPAAVNAWSMCSLKGGRPLRTKIDRAYTVLAAARDTLARMGSGGAAVGEDQTPRKLGASPPAVSVVPTAPTSDLYQVDAAACVLMDAGLHKETAHGWAEKALRAAGVTILPDEPAASPPAVSQEMVERGVAAAEAVWARFPDLDARTVGTCRREAIRAAITAALTPAPAGERVCHVKRGTEYSASPLARKPEV